MKLEDVILHLEEVADRCALTDGNRQCEDEHKQLALWLKDYKRLLEQQKAGKWIDDNDYDEYYGKWFECSVCHGVSMLGNYCPDCGAKMESVDSKSNE